MSVDDNANQQESLIRRHRAINNSKLGAAIDQDWITTQYDSPEPVVDSSEDADSQVVTPTAMTSEDLRTQPMLCVPTTCYIEIWAGQLFEITPWIMAIPFLGEGIYITSYACHTWMIVKPCNGEARRFEVWQDEYSDEEAAKIGATKLGKHLYRGLNPVGGGTDSGKNDSPEAGDSWWGYRHWRVCRIEEECPCPPAPGAPAATQPCCERMADDELWKKYVFKDQYSYVGTNSNTVQEKALDVCVNSDENKRCTLPACAIGSGAAPDFDFFGKYTGSGFHYNPIPDVK